MAAAFMVHGRRPHRTCTRSIDGSGLAELEHGLITPAQFAALNAGIGGYDPAGNPVAQRTQADRKALTAAYRDDIVSSAGLGLRSTPIIDQREDLDTAGPLFDIHTSEWSFATRTRLLAANGTFANQVIIDSGASPADVAAANVYELDAMDRWLTTIDADHSPRSGQAKVIAAKPADLGDGCFRSATDRVLAPVTDPATGPCSDKFPVGADPRQEAGAPLSAKVLKCALRPLDFADYPVTFTAAEQTLLRNAFPTGMCDYTRPGVGQEQRAHAWRDYGDG